MEKIFLHFSQYFSLLSGINLSEYLVNKFSEYIVNDSVLTCHDLKLKMYKRYAVFRLKILNDKKKQIQNKRYDSKSVAMHLQFQ